MSNLKYGCFLTKEVEGRCIEVVSEYKGGIQYETLQDCIKKCNKPKEKEALDNLKKKFRFKSIPEFIRPSLIETFDKMKDIPILNYDDKMYTKPILNYDEFNGLYAILNISSSHYKHSNPFLEDIIISLNGIIGNDLIITNIIENKITQLDDKSDNKYYFHFEEDEYKENFNKEIDDFIASPKSYLIKNILINMSNNKSGHHTLLLIKKKGDELNIFMYDPTSYIGRKDIISKRIEYFMKNQIKINFSFLNLSKIYGIQDLEILNFDERLNYDISYLENNFNNTLQMIDKIIIDLGNNFIIDAIIAENKRNKKPGAFLIYSKSLLDDLNKYEFVKNDIELQLSEIDENMFMLSKQKRGVNYMQIVENIIKIQDSLHDKFTDFMNRYIHDKMKYGELLNKIRNFYNYDVFSHNCYMWSYYTIILILINQNINPYDIIKSSYYQSSNLTKMESIFDNIKNKIEKFSTNYFIESNENYEKLKEKFERKKLNDYVYEHKRIIYIKITNLILLNILYNRIDNKYLLFSLEKKCIQDICLKTFIPEKVNDIIDKLSFDKTNLTTKENILEKIKDGLKINDLNSLILSDKTSSELNYNIHFREFSTRPDVRKPSPPLPPLETPLPPLDKERELRKLQRNLQKKLKNLKKLISDDTSVILPTKTSQLKNILGLNTINETNENRSKYLKYKNKYINLKSYINK